MAAAVTVSGKGKDGAGPRDSTTGDNKSLELFLTQPSRDDSPGEGGECVHVVACTQTAPNLMFTLMCSPSHNGPGEYGRSDGMSLPRLGYETVVSTLVTLSLLGHLLCRKKACEAVHRVGT